MGLVVESVGVLTDFRAFLQLSLTARVAADSLLPLALILVVVPLRSRSHVLAWMLPLGSCLKDISPCVPSGVAGLPLAMSSLIS